MRGRSLLTRYQFIWSPYSILGRTLLTKCYGWLNAKISKTDGDLVETTRWASDPDIVCFSGYHVLFSLVAFIGIVVWTFGYVALCMWLLFRNRNNLVQTNTVRKYGFLYLGYSRNRWYWESVKRCQAFLYGLISTMPMGNEKNSLYSQSYLAYAAYFMSLLGHLIRVTTVFWIRWNHMRC